MYVAEFGMTWDDLDLSGVPFEWNEQPDPDSKWIINGNAVLAAVLPNRIQAIQLLSADIHGRCGGVEIQFQDGQRLIVANYGDELFLGTTMPPDPFEPVPWPSPEAGSSR